LEAGILQLETRANDFHRRKSRCCNSSHKIWAYHILHNFTAVRIKSC